MKTVEINGKTIKTNYFNPGYNGYPITNGNRCGRSFNPLWIKEDNDVYAHLESVEEMFYRLVEEGYTTITFYEMTTAVRGCHHIIAYCKR